MDILKSLYEKYGIVPDENRTPPTLEEMAKMRADGMNALDGQFNDGFDCPICKNKGRVFYAEGKEVYNEPCKCMPRREAVRAVRRTGADVLLKIHSFADYDTDEKWQRTIFQKAKTFAELDAGLWCISGQVGCGKTKISIAILNRLLERGKESRYFIWQNLVGELTRLKMENYGRYYDSRLDEITSMPVLYIDDFLRNDDITQNEIKIAYDIINARYMRTLGGKQLITILSAQRHIRDILNVDEAIGSRICEIGGEYIIDVADDEARNYRMKLARERAKKASV